MLQIFAYFGDDLTGLGLTQPEITMAEQLVEAMVKPWDPAEYKDDFRDDLLRVIEEKQRLGQGEAITPAQPAAAPGEGKVIDIMALLKRSVEEVRGASAGDGEDAGVADAGAPERKAARGSGGKGGGARRRTA